MNAGNPCSKGSLSLTMLASTASGLLFVLLFANVLRYMLAAQAVQHAAERAARCISPTDGDCVSESPPPLADARDWFAAEQAKQQTTWTDRYDYSAILFRQDWEATANGFQVHLVREPFIRWSAYRLPLATFQYGLNQFEYRIRSLEARVIAEVPEQHYRVSPIFAAVRTNFPDFDADYEVSLDQAPAAAWHPRVLLNRTAPSRGFRNFVELGFQAVSLSTQVLSAGSVGQFTTGYFEVPVLPSNSPTVTCEDTAGASCDVTRYAGARGVNNYTWQRYAAVAIKPFAELRRLSGNPSIGWRGAPGAGGKHWGLQLEVLTAADFQNFKARRDAAAAAGQIPPSPPSGTIRCLGGRTATGSLPLGSVHDFHMWLRGPKGANGGGDPNCPVAQNTINDKHDSIFVERGGAYRITGFLEVERTGAVEAKVSFQHYVDSYEPYQRRMRRELSCSGTAAANAGEGENACHAEEVCGDKTILSTLSCKVLAVHPAPVCLTGRQAQSDPHAFPLSAVNCRPSRTAILCNPGDKPLDPADCSTVLAANPGRISCGWMEETDTESAVELLQVPGGCSLASAAARDAPCSLNAREIVYRPDGEYGDAASCPNALNTLKQFQSAAQSLNAAQPKGTVQLPPQSAEMTWSVVDPTTERWAPVLELPDDLKSQSGNPEIVRTGLSKHKNLRAQFRHYDSGWQPPLSAFGFYGLASADQSAPSQIEIRLLEEQPYAVERGYPFAAKPEFEISPGLPPGTCKDSAVPIEDTLRAYAALSIPEAADPGVVLVTAAAYVDSVATSKQGGCNPAENFSTPLPSCTSPGYQQVETPICHTRRYLGRFSARDFPDGPPICGQSRDYRCFSETEDLRDLEADTEQLNLAAAQRKGLEEIQRTFPGAALGCEGIQCTNVSISKADADHVEIAVNYQLPLGFPLSSIFGKDILSIESTKIEMREKSIAGRFATAQGEDES